MLPVSGAEQLKTSGAQCTRPMISQSGAYSRFVRLPPCDFGRQRFQSPAAFAFGFGALMLRGIWISRTGLLAQVGSVLQAFVATGIGVWRSIQGARFQTWNPPASTREQIDSARYRAALGHDDSDTNPTLVKSKVEQTNFGYP